MSIKEMIYKFTHKEPEVYGDYETRDNYLRSLRRERRIQMEQLEKKRLKQQIEAYKKKQREETLWGTKKNLLKSKNHFKPKRKEKWL